jgi:hypothetical protein
MDEIQRHLEAGGSINISLALKSLRPGASWAIRGQEYSGLEWRDNTQEKPTEQELLDEVERLTALRQQLAYRGQRRVEYPSIEDQLDMLWHEMDQGNTPKLASFYNAIKAVKDKHPKA